jgi:hypothetical protein
MWSNKTGLHFHVECAADAHHCPGNNVQKDDVGLRVSALMAQLSGGQQPTDAVA